MSSIVQVVLRGNWNEEGEGKKHKTIKAEWSGEQLQLFKYSNSAAAGEAGVMKVALLVAVHFQLSCAFQALQQRSGKTAGSSHSRLQTSFRA